MATEKFLTDYTEVDSGTDITLTDAKCDVSTMTREVNSSVYKDFTAGHFGQFVHYIEAYYSTSDTLGWGGIYHISNTQAATCTDLLTANIGLGVYFYEPVGGTFNLTIQQFTDDNNDTYVCAATTLYYLTITRTGAVNTCKVYDDSARTNLLDTLTVTFDATTYRYVGGVFSREGSGTSTITYYCQDLDLNEAAAGVSIPIILSNFRYRK